MAGYVLEKLIDSIFFFFLIKAKAKYFLHSPFCSLVFTFPEFSSVTEEGEPELFLLL